MHIYFSANHYKLYTEYRDLLLILYLYPHLFWQNQSRIEDDRGLKIGDFSNLC